MRRLFLARWQVARAAFNRYLLRSRQNPRLAALELAGWLLLAIVFFSYVRAWWEIYSAALTDPHLQTDDARTALFPFHRYAPGHPLANDPIANEMIEYQPYAYRLIFRVCVPLMGLLASAKVAQGLCLLIVVAGGWVLARSPRAGVGAGAIFLFLFMRDSAVMNRIGGGLPRSFGFPVLSLWLAGCVAHRPNARRAGAIIAALTYPSALAMVLGAEGIYCLRRFGRPGWRTTWRRLRHYLLLVVACAALFAPTALLTSSDGGPVHTMAQAEEEPAFSKAGRLWVLPLPNPGSAFGEHVLRPFQPYGASPIEPVTEAIANYREFAGAIVGVFIVVLVLGLAPPPIATASFLASSLILYALAVVFAFRLYSPERFYSYGMHVVAAGLVLSAVGPIFPRVRYRKRRVLRAVTSAAMLFTLWVLFGAGGARRSAMAMTINYGHHEPMWRFLRTLPAETTRIASFLMDGDDIPLFAARANNGGFETMQPWLTKSWARQKARAEDTLRAFYSTDQGEVLAYAKKYHVSHLLVNQSRYRGDFVRRAATFQPLTAFSNELLANRRLEDLVLAHVPPETIVFREGDLQLVDVAKLEKAWGKQH